MKVERKEQEVFKPITITLQTEEDLVCMKVIAGIAREETLKEAHKRISKECCFEIDLQEVDDFGGNLGSDLHRFLDC